MKECMVELGRALPGVAVQQAQRGLDCAAVRTNAVSELAEQQHRRWGLGA